MSVLGVCEFGEQVQNYMKRANCFSASTKPHVKLSTLIYLPLVVVPKSQKFTIPDAVA